MRLPRSDPGREAGALGHREASRQRPKSRSRTVFESGHGAARGQFEAPLLEHIESHQSQVADISCTRSGMSSSRTNSTSSGMSRQSP